MGAVEPPPPPPTVPFMPSAPFTLWLELGVPPEPPPPLPFDPNWTLVSLKFKSELDFLILLFNKSVKDGSLCIYVDFQSTNGTILGDY